MQEIIFSYVTKGKIFPQSYKFSNKNNLLSRKNRTSCVTDLTKGLIKNSRHYFQFYHYGI